MRLLCTFVPNAEVWAGKPHIRKSAFRKRSCSCRPHTTGALHHPSLKADHLRTALRESDIPILIVVHDWALLLGRLPRESDYILFK